MTAIKPEYRQLPVRLTEEERLSRATKAGELSKKYRETELEKKAQTSVLGAQLKELRAEMERNLDASRTGVETQPVQIEKRRNEDRLTIELVRVDTQEVIESRAMTVEERQGKLFAIPGGKQPERGPFEAKTTEPKQDETKVELAPGVELSSGHDSEPPKKKRAAAKRPSKSRGAKSKRDDNATPSV